MKVGTRLAKDVDVVQLFVTREVDLTAKIRPACDALVTAGALWVSWPKGKAKAALATDLDDGVVRTIGLGVGWVDVKVCAVDAVWSGLKLVRRVKDRD